MRELQDPLWSLSTKNLPAGIMNVEARSAHSELSNTHSCLQTHREARMEESQPWALPLARKDLPAANAPR